MLHRKKKLQKLQQTLLSGRRAAGLCHVLRRESTCSCRQEKGRANHGFACWSCSQPVMSPQRDPRMPICFGSTPSVRTLRSFHKKEKQNPFRLLIQKYRTVHVSHFLLIISRSENQSYSTKLNIQCSPCSSVISTETSISERNKSLGSFC